MKIMAPLVLTITMILSGCIGILGPSQDLSKANYISAGMTKREVAETMGAEPVATEFSGRFSEWHFCKSDEWTGENHRFVAVYFGDDKVIAMKPYSVSLSRRTGDADCRPYVKKGNYKEPDEVREYRIKFE